jgi:hypothetical protein
MLITDVQVSGLGLYISVMVQDVALVVPKCKCWLRQACKGEGQACKVWAPGVELWGPRASVLDNATGECARKQVSGCTWGA